MTIAEVCWIACADEMPDDDRTVLYYAPREDEPIWLGYVDGGRWHADNGAELRYPVTHWADLPAPPEEK